MKGEIAVEVHRLMNRLYELEKEKKELSAKVRNEDLQALGQKLGGRCVCLTVEAVKQSIDNDIIHNQQKLDEFIGCRTYEIESKLRVSMLHLLKDVFDKQFNGFENLRNEQRIIISQMIEDKVEEIIMKLK